MRNASSKVSSANHDVGLSELTNVVDVAQQEWYEKLRDTLLKQLDELGLP